MFTRIIAWLVTRAYRVEYKTPLGVTTGSDFVRLCDAVEFYDRVARDGIKPTMKGRYFGLWI